MKNRKHINYDVVPMLVLTNLQASLFIEFAVNDNDYSMQSVSYTRTEVTIMMQQN
jgi:hypothetical protein